MQKSGFIKRYLPLATFSLIALLFSGCALTIPYSKNLDIKSFETTREKKNLCIVIDRELAHKEYGGLRQGVRIGIGEGIKSGLNNGLKKYFDKICFSSSTADTIQYDYMLKPELVYFNADLGMWVYDTRTIYLTIKYKLYDNSNNMLFNLVTENQGKGKKTKGEFFSGCLIPISKAKSCANAVGRAWDRAISESINNLLDKMQEQNII